MRIHIPGECPAAKAVRGYLRRQDFHITNFRPDWTVRIEEQPGLTQPVLDSIHCELDQAILRHLRKQTATPITIQTAGGVESDREVRILVPPVEAERKAVEVSVFRALLEMANQHEASSAASSRAPWWKRSF